MIWLSLRMLKFEQKRNIWTPDNQLSLQINSIFYTKFQLQKSHNIQPYELELEGQVC